MQAIKHLHPDMVAAVHGRALFSKQEETYLGKITSVRISSKYSCVSSTGFINFGLNQKIVQ